MPTYSSGEGKETIFKDENVLWNWHSVFLNKIKTKNLKIENCCDLYIHVYILHQVSDFGLSEWKTVTMTATRRTDIADSSERRCTVSHVPPELWIDINTPADRFFDIYSFGICVWETLTGAVPYGSMWTCTSQICKIKNSACLI